jgi:hypothetical protein
LSMNLWLSLGRCTNIPPRSVFDSKG